MSRTTALAVAAVLVVLGIAAFPLQNLGRPDSVCAKEGAPTSGFIDDEKECGITQESFQKIADYDSKPQVWRIAGIVLIVAGVGMAVYGVTRKRRTPPSSPEAPVTG